MTRKLYRTDTDAVRFPARTCPRLGSTGSRTITPARRCKLVPPAPESVPGAAIKGGHFRPADSAPGTDVRGGVDQGAARRSTADELRPTMMDKHDYPPIMLLRNQLQV